MEGRVVSFPLWGTVFELCTSEHVIPRQGCDIMAFSFPTGKKDSKEAKLWAVRETLRILGCSDFGMLIVESNSSIAISCIFITRIGSVWMRRKG